MTYLDPTTAQKADIDVKKRSFGVLKGSAVTLQEDKDHSNTLYVAEGVETALSLKSAGVKGNILASLGLSNITRLDPAPGTKIIVCADHDAPDSPALKTLNNAIAHLKDQGHEVHVIKPETQGHDFNDVLKLHGIEGVRAELQLQLPEALKTNAIFNDVHAHSPVEEKPFRLTPEQAKPTITQAIKSDNISPALQAVYEEWKKPEFAWAKNVIHAFNQGIKIEGEDKAIAYWNERKDELYQDYHEMQRDIKYMLNSHRLSHLTEKEKIKAQELGQMNPKGVLDHLYNIQLDQLSKQSEKATPAQIQNPLNPTPKIEKPEVLYAELVQIRTSLPKGQMTHSKEDRDRMYALSFKLSQNQGFMEKLKTDDIAMARLIQSQAAAHQRELRSLDNSRGGIER